MLPDLGPNAHFIWSSYAVAGVVLGAVVAWLILAGHHHARALAALEAQGIRRRSSGGAESPGDHA